MKKLAAGIAAISAVGTAFGQTHTTFGELAGSVQVYGVADVAIAHYTSSGTSQTAMHPGGSGSRIGFLAREDLGQGFRTSVRLEAGFNMDSGTLSSTNGRPDRMWSRQAYLELANTEFGAVRVGRQEGPTYKFFPRFDPMLVPSMDAWGVLTTLGAPAPGRGSGTGVSSGFLINPTQRTQNTIAYISPKWNGLHTSVAYSLNENSDVDPKLLEAYLEYGSERFTVGALFVHASGTSGSGTTRATAPVSEFAIGAKYQFGPIHPYLTFIRRNVTDPTIGGDGQVLNGSAETVKLIGAVIPVSARGNVRITYGRYGSGSPGRDASSYGIAYTYEVNRRLMLMAAITRLTQDGAGTWPVFQSPKPNPGSAVNGVAAGLTWRF